MRVLLADDHALLARGPAEPARGARHRGGRHGQERRGGQRRGATAAPGRDPHGHPHAGLRRAHGHARSSRRRCRRSKIVILTTSSEDEDLFEAVKSGASGYLLKSMDAESLIERSARRAAGRPALRSRPGGQAAGRVRADGCGGDSGRRPRGREPERRGACADDRLRSARSRSATASSKCSPWWREGSRTRKSASAST